jgi:hypothetical protein
VLLESMVGMPEFPAIPLLPQAANPLSYERLRDF